MDRMSSSLNEVGVDGTNEPSSTEIAMWKTPVNTIEQLSCEWMRNSESIWRNWKPKDENGKIPLYIGGIFPITGSYTARGILIGELSSTHDDDDELTYLYTYCLP